VPLGIRIDDEHSSAQSTARFIGLIAGDTLAGHWSSLTSWSWLLDGRHSGGALGAALVFISLVDLAAWNLTLNKDQPCGCFSKDLMVGIE
jgi:hypothetical protein